MSPVAKKVDEWTDSQGHHVVAGDEVKVKDQRGRFVFVSAWVKEDGTADVWVHGGLANRKSRRAFPGERVIKIEVKKRRRTA